jgi:Protein of unknown function (DUF2971)
MWHSRYDLDQPEKDIRIWRYFPAERFIAFLKSSNLYFRRADLFDDPLEGRTPVGTVKEIFDEPLPPEIACAVLYSRDKFRENAFVSCWHENQDENPFMWEKYAENHSGVAVYTTYDRFTNSLVCQENCVVARVRYLDMSSDKGSNDVCSQLLQKDIDYSHEKEVRAIHLTNLKSGLYSDLKNPNEGLFLSVPLPILMQGVIFGKNISESHSNLIRSELENFGLLNRLSA